METVILGILGAVLSLVFTYYPKAKTWLEGFEHKGLVMLGGVVLVAAGYFGVACSSWAVDLGVTLTCDRAGFIELFRAVFLIAGGNQLTFLMTRKSEARG
jgi:hypothetical protein